MYLILGLLVFIVVLMVIVIVHEGGHFLVAKKSGILCHEFSVGMGPLICQKKKGETFFSLRAVPLGGYVSMAGEEIEFDILKGVNNVRVKVEDGYVTLIGCVLDNPKYIDLPIYKLVGHDLMGTVEALPNELYLDLEDEEGNVQTFLVARDCMINYKKNELIQNAPSDRVFVNKPILNRFLSVFAGPLMNFVFAVVIFFISGLIFGYADTSSTKIKGVSGPALESGLTDGDTLNKIGNYTLTDFNSIGDALEDQNLAQSISTNGGVDVYYTNSSNNELKVTVYPFIYLYSCEMVLKYDKTTPSDEVIVGDYGDVMKDTKAYLGGLRAGDVIKRINNTTINNIKDIVTFFASAETEAAKTLKFYVERANSNELIECNVESYSKAMLDTQNIPRTKATLGVSTGMTKRLSLLVTKPFEETADAATQIFKTLGLFFKKDAGVKITDLSGPVGISNLFINLVKGDDAFYNILHWTGLLSVNIGLINLLPLPALDGGRLAFIIYEAITRKKPNAKVENMIHNIGFLLLLGLFVVITISDIARCF